MARRSFAVVLGIAATVCIALSVVLIRLRPPVDSIHVTHHPSAEVLSALGVSGWSPWQREPSEFFWTFATQETAYVLEGEVYLTPDGGSTIVIRPGDLVVFEPGLRCHWRVTKEFKKRATVKDDFFDEWVWRMAFKTQGLMRRISAVASYVLDPLLGRAGR